MTEDHDTHVELRVLLLHALGDLHRSARALALGDEHDAAILRLAEAILDRLSELVFLEGKLGDDRSFRSRSDSAVEGKEASFTPHDLYEEEAVM